MTLPLIQVNGFSASESSVTSVFGRTGAVVAVNGDYTFAQIGAGTNAVALVVGTGGSLAVSGSGTIAATSVTGLSIASGKTATINNSLTFAGTDSTTFTFPSGSDTVVTLTASQTLTNKTLTSPTINGPQYGVYTSSSFPLTNQQIMNGLANGSLAGFVEEFWSTGTNTISAATSFSADTTWSAAPITTGTTGTIASTSATFQNPGQCLMTTPATATAGISLYKGGGANNAAPFGILGNNALWQVDAWFTTNSTLASYACRVGTAISADQVEDAPGAGNWFEIDSSNTSDTGGAATHGTITGGTLYTTGTYTNVPITGGSGTGLLATVVVSGGAVTTVTFNTGTGAGSGYKAADTGLSAAAANIGGTGSGFSFGLASITQDWMLRVVNSSTSTYTDTAVQAGATQVVHIRLYSVAAGTILGQIGVANGAMSSSFTVNTNVDTTHAHLPIFQVLARTGTAVTLAPDRYSFVSVPGRV